MFRALGSLQFFKEHFLVNYWWRFYFVPAGVSNPIMFQLDYYFVCNSLFKRSIFKQATRVVLRPQCYGSLRKHPFLLALLFLLAKRPQRQRARRNGCFCRLMLWWLHMSLCKWRRRFWYSRRMQSFRIIIKSFCTSFTAVSFSCISVSFSLSAAFSSSSRMRILASLLRTTSKNRIHMISVRLETVWFNWNRWKMHHTFANKIWISQYKLHFLAWKDKYKTCH